MTKNIDDAVSDITDKIFKSGIIQNNIQEGSLSGLKYQFQEMKRRGV